jgi:hypothetical protein
MDNFSLGYTEFEVVCEAPPSAGIQNAVRSVSLELKSEVWVRIRSFGVWRKRK